MVVVSVVTVVGSEVTLVVLVMTQGGLALDLTRVEMEGSPTEAGEGMKRHGTEIACHRSAIIVRSTSPNN